MTFGAKYSQTYSLISVGSGDGRALKRCGATELPIAQSINVQARYLHQQQGLAIVFMHPVQRQLGRFNLQETVWGIEIVVQCPGSRMGMLNPSKTTSTNLVFLKFNLSFLGELSALDTLNKKSGEHTRPKAPT